MQETRRNLFLLLSGQFISMLGSSIHLVVVILFLKDLTGSASALGFFQFVAYLPIVLLSPLAGVVADSINSKHIIVGTDLLRGTLMMILAFLLFQNRLTYALLLVGTFLISVCTALFHPAVHALFPALTPLEHLRSANSTKSASLLGANFTGTFVGGLLYSSAGPALVFLLNGFSFSISAVEEAFITYLPEKKGVKTALFPRVKEQIRELIFYVQHEKGLLTLLLTYSLINALYPPVVLSLPFLLETKFGLGSSYFGFALGLLLAGGGVGTLAYGFSKTKLVNNSSLFFSAFIGLSFLLIGVGFLESPVLLLLILPAAGFSIGLIHQIMTTSLYRLVRTDARGRVFGLMESMASFSLPFAYAFGGIFIQLFHSQLSLFYILMGSAVMTAAVGIYYFSSLKLFITRTSGKADFR